LLCDGIAADSRPFTHYCDGEYAGGGQNPILAWGVWNFHALCPDRDQLARNFPALERYVKWWLRNCDATGSGLAVRKQSAENVINLSFDILSKNALYWAYEDA